MKDKIIRARKFVHDHRCEVSAASGFAVGAVVMYRTMKTPELQNLALNVTTEQMQKVLDTPGAWVEFETPTQMIHLVVDHT